MTRTRIKICGITREEDALAAVALGVDALGFVFYGPSPRNVSPEIAAQICKRLPAYVTTVGLFVDPDPAWVNEVCSKVHLDLLQFHGDETDAFCASFGRRYYKALRMRPELDLRQAQSAYPQACAMLVDTYVPGVAGGTGEVFDWQRLPNSLPIPLILAGGLNTENVAAAIQQVRPYAVDVSGGIESAKGIKDHSKMMQFVREVQRGDRL